MPDSPLYIAAREHLGEHLTLDPSVPEEVGCCEAVSYVLKSAGYPIPPRGIASVNALITWLLANGFDEVTYPSAGCLVTAHQSDVNKPNYAHVGVVLKYGIASNNSSNGIFAENYTVDGWNHYFTFLHGSKTRYFKPLNPTQ